ncbi:MAG: transporter [Flavobacteriaceae bacterium]|nr:transporter [Flavobacteriaceae bacterium]
MEALKSVIVIVLFLINFTLTAQKIITDRPDQTESSSTIAKGSLQIESGMLLGFTEIDEISLKTIIAPSTLFRYGLTDGIEIRVVNQFVSIENRNISEDISGIADLEIGTKIQIYQQEDKNVEVAFLSHLVLPTGSNDVSFNKVGTINKLSVSHEINDKIGLGYNLGYNYFGIENGFFTYSLVLGMAINDKAGIYLEPYGEIDISDQYLSNFDAGFTYLLKDNFQLDFSFGTGLNYSMNYISAGFSWHLGPHKS